MQSFNFNDALSFRLATQQEDTGAKLQVFFGVFFELLPFFIGQSVVAWVDFPFASAISQQLYNYFEKKVSAEINFLGSNAA